MRLDEGDMAVTLPKPIERIRRHPLRAGRWRDDFGDRQTLHAIDQQVLGRAAAIGAVTQEAVDAPIDVIEQFRQGRRIVAVASCHVCGEEVAGAGLEGQMQF